MMNQKNPLSQKVKIKIKGEVPVLSEDVGNYGK